MKSFREVYQLQNSLAGFPFVRDELHHILLQSKRDISPQLITAVFQNKTGVRSGDRILDVSMSSSLVLE